MAIDDLTMFCMLMTPFKEDGSIDEAALRAHLRRVSASGNGVYLGSPASAEANALTLDEMRRIYEIGVEECKGKVPVHANPREGRTAAEACDIAKLAMSAGVDVIMIYELASWHNSIPTPAEQEAYFREVLETIDWPIAISIGRAYRAPIALLKKLQQDYPQICAIFPAAPSDYFLAVRDAMPPSISMYSNLPNIVQALALGATGCVGAVPNILPNTCHGIIESYASGAMEQLGRNVQTVQRFNSIVGKWGPGYPRWLKMASKVLGLPGGNGVLRKPYVLPPDEDLARMAQAFEELGLRKIEGLA